MAETMGSREGGRGTGDTLASWIESLATTMPASRREYVAGLLREAIVHGVIGPGQQLKQDELCAQFGVSPAPVREALRQLESEGLVRHYPNRGMFVAEVSIAEFVDVLLPVRLALESYAFRTGVARYSEATWKQLADLAQAMEDGVRRGDLNTINEADVRFHQVGVVASSAPHTIQLWNSVLPRIRMQMYRLALRHNELAEIPAEHHALLDVLRERDPEAIHAALDEHIVGTALQLLDAGTADR